MEYRPEQIYNVTKDRGLSVFIAILSCYTVIFTGIAIWRYENFLIGESGDLLIFEQVIYNTLHGRPFYNTTDGQNHFGVHNSQILALLVPFAAIIPVPYVLYASTALSIAISAIPIYLIAREELRNEILALLLGFCYIMLPALVGQVYLSFHEINLVLPFLTFAFYYFVKERFYPFMAIFMLGLMVKEDVSLTFFIFSIYAMIKKRDMKWYLFPGISSITWLILSLKVIIPFFDKAHHYPMIGYFSDMGDSFSEIITNTITHPTYILYRLLLPYKLLYLYVLILPVGLILPFLSTEILFTFPSLLLNMLAESSRFRLLEGYTPYGAVPIPRHMSLIAATFLFISALYSIKKISLLFAKQAISIKFILTFLILLGVGYSDRFIILGENVYQRPSYVASSQSIKKILSQIPLQATVKADREIAAYLYERREVNPPVDTDYLVFQGNFFAYKMDKENGLEFLSNYSDALKTGNLLLFNEVGKPINVGIREKYDLVALEKGVALFKMKIQ